jgi:protoporphyrinogen/coproporphyrinogen III oxidase
MSDGVNRRPGPTPRHVVVVGGGISGLAAAWFLHRDGPSDLTVTVLEGSPAIGGKLQVSEVAGIPVDEGAESLLLRRPEAVDLAVAVGLGDDLEDAATTSAAIWSRGEMRPIPTGTVMGIPADLRALARTGLLSTRELARVPADSWLPGSPLSGDVAVGRHVARRMGRAVVERLVEPLLGGVYAGRADLLSLDATMPALAAPARRHRSLLAAAREARANGGAASGGGADGAVFGAPRGGVGRLPAAVARASAATVRTKATVRQISRTPTGWALTVGSTRDPQRIDADAVILEVPPPAAARLLRDVVPAAAAELSVVRSASMAVITVAFARTAFGSPPQGSGFLVPPADGRVVKAATFSSTKWGWYANAAPALVVVRLSVGRLDEEADLQRDDADLVEVALADLTDAVGVTDPPVDARVSRWGGGLPQYAVGHVGRVQRVRAAVASHPGLAVCGATYDGVGIPACVASAESAAAEVLRQWTT